MGTSALKHSSKSVRFFALKNVSRTGTYFPHNSIGWSCIGDCYSIILWSIEWDFKTVNRERFCGKFTFRIYEFWPLIRYCRQSNVSIVTIIIFGQFWAFSTRIDRLNIIFARATDSQPVRWRALDSTMLLDACKNRCIRRCRRGGAGHRWIAFELVFGRRRHQFCFVRVCKYYSEYVKKKINYLNLKKKP